MIPGTILDRYRILSLLDRGGMGEVYLAEDTTLGRKVALKLLPTELVRDDDRLRRFVQEAKAASALNHPNILTIHEVGQVGDTHFLAAEFIDGETLRKQISRTARCHCVKRWTSRCKRPRAWRPPMPPASSIAT